MQNIYKNLLSKVEMCNGHVGIKYGNGMESLESVLCPCARSAPQHFKLSDCI